MMKYQLNNFKKLMKTLFKMFKEIVDYKNLVK